MNCLVWANKNMIHITPVSDLSDCFEYIKSDIYPYSDYDDFFGIDDTEQGRRHFSILKNIILNVKDLNLEPSKTHSGHPFLKYENQIRSLEIFAIDDLNYWISELKNIKVVGTKESFSKLTEETLSAKYHRNQIIQKLLDKN